MIGRVQGTDESGLQALVDGLLVTTSEDSTTAPRVAPQWTSMIDAEQSRMQEQAGTTGRNNANREMKNCNVVVVPRYDIAYLDGDFESGVEEAYIQHRHVSVHACMFPPFAISGLLFSASDICPWCCLSFPNFASKVAVGGNLKNCVFL